MKQKHKQQQDGRNAIPILSILNITPKLNMAYQSSKAMIDFEGFCQTRSARSADTIPPLCVFLPVGAMRVG